MERHKKVFLRKIDTLNDPLILKVQATYISSFPSNERRDFFAFCDLLICEPLFCMYVILDGEQYVGFISCWSFTDFVYVEHFAINPDKRSGGIGSFVIRQFINLMTLPVVLEVENVVDDLTARRVRFYEKAGFILHHLDYKQPPYRKSDAWYDLQLMSYGPLDMKNTFESVRDTIYCHVYGIKNLTNKMQPVR
jgi:ribosomal protein S18 acetylase RimI-like enzyme